WIVAPLLKPVAGVNEVNSFGGEVKQYQVLVHPDRLVKYGLSIREVTEALERSNGNAGGGVLVNGWEQTYLRGVGLLRDIPDIERVVLRAQDGTPVYVRDIADVEIGAEPRQGAVTRDGRGETVAGMVIMLKGENSKDVVTRVKDAIGRAQGVLPPGARIAVFYDRTSLIEASIETVTDALLEGGLLVVLVLFLFVAEFRTALVVLFSLPFTFLVSFIVMGRRGLTSNLMSLGGLAFSVGMVVDASIVVVENARRHLAESPDGTDHRGIVARAVMEVAKPVSFSVLVIAVILVPLFSLQGVEGKMFAPLASTMLIALLVSLVVALTVIPVLSDAVLPRSPERQFRFIRRLHAGYVRLLDHFLAFPKRALLTSLGLLVVAGALIPFVGTEFMPPLDEGAIAINVVRLPNASLQGSVEVARYLEGRIREHPEVETVVSKTGRAEISEDPMGPEQTDVFVMLKPRRAFGSGRSRAELAQALQQDLSQIPGLRFSFSQPIALRVNELISGVKSDLAVKVFGNDLALLKGFADRIAVAVSGIRGATDVKVEQVSGLDQYDAVIDREAAARHGISVGDVNDTIESAIAGKAATTLVEDQRRFAVVVRFTPEGRSDLEAVSRLLVAAPGGERVPLAQLASIRRVEAPAQVSRENGIRRVVVEANIRGRDLGGFVAEVQERLRPFERELPAGSFLELGGQFENQQRAMRTLAVVVPVALALILLLLYLALGSFRDALLVLLNLPFALVGGIVAVVLFRMPLSVSAAIAFVVLLGVAVQNGVVLVAFLRQLRDRGRTAAEAVREGCSLRFRPLLMTALTSFIGHLPMLYAQGSGADIQKPLAVVVMGGLLTSTALTLLVLPALYSELETGRQRRGAPARAGTEAACAGRKARGTTTGSAPTSALAPLAALLAFLVSPIPSRPVAAD
ncbi:MAG: Heavy metal efflux pump CzcA, partial [Anaeromyxobacteraceae bacterium]|nr:Heavy metal efflux pump CzcA [Anaeromyxobacteraceae bacterium]